MRMGGAQAPLPPHPPRRTSEASPHAAFDRSLVIAWARLVTVVASVDSIVTSEGHAIPFEGTSDPRLVIVAPLEGIVVS